MMTLWYSRRRTVRDASCVRVDHSSYAARPAPIGTMLDFEGKSYRLKEATARFARDTSNDS